MEMVRIPRDKYERMLKELKLFRELRGVDWNLVKQFKDSLDDVKARRIKRVA